MLMLKYILKILGEALKAILQCLGEKSAYLYLKAVYGGIAFLKSKEVMGLWRGNSAYSILPTRGVLLTNEKP